MKSKLFYFSLTLLFTGCSALNTFVQDINIISISEEKELGKQLSAEVEKELAILAMNQRVRSLSNQLVGALEHRQFNYTFKIVEDSSPNAFTIPGGYIYIHSGMLDFTNDKELAGVLAHEIGHAHERHPTQSLSRAYGVNYLTSLVFKENKNKMKGLAVQIAQGGILNKYGRNDELEADEAAFSLLKRTRLPSDGLLSFLKKIAQLGGDFPIPFLSSHPPTQERIDRLEAMERGSG
jgi:beta-barrel assembly-enhancing protease